MIEKVKFESSQQLSHTQELRWTWTFFKSRAKVRDAGLASSSHLCPRPAQALPMVSWRPSRSYLPQLVERGMREEAYWLDKAVALLGKQQMWPKMLVNFPIIRALQDMCRPRFFSTLIPSCPLPHFFVGGQDPEALSRTRWSSSGYSSNFFVFDILWM